MDYAAQHILDKSKPPEWLTGPAASQYCVTTGGFGERPPLVVFEPPVIYPYSWEKGSVHARCVCSAQLESLNTETCKSLWGDESYAVTYWSQRCALAVLNHSWNRGSHDVLEGLVGS